jgi:molecular chaperone GrpE (heat shock protein)
MMNDKDIKKRKDSTASATQQLIHCFNLSSNLIRDCEKLNSELRSLHSILFEQLQQDETKKITLLSQYRKALETIVQIHEKVNDLIGSHESNQPNLVEIFKGFDIILKNCMNEQSIEVMKVPIGKQMMPGFQTTEGTHAVVHNSEPGTIVSVVQQGYIQRDGEQLRVVRPAVVQVSAGSEKQNNLKRKGK